MSKVAYYDGQSSTRHEVDLNFDSLGNVRLRFVDGGEQRYTFAQLKFEARLGHLPRKMHLPNGALCELVDHATVDRLLARLAPTPWQNMRHVLESRFSLALLSLVFSLLFIYGTLEYGIPWISWYVAKFVPPQMEKEMGDQAIQAMFDRGVFAPSKLNKNELTGYKEVFQRVVDGQPMEFKFQLHCVQSEALGANAFALPGGHIVLTDDLAKLFANKEEAQAIFAHEMGHVVHRHSLRKLMQSSLATLVVVAITGDVTSISALAAGIPTLLLDLKFSRHMENEADDYALDYMRQHNIAANHFAAILEKLANKAHDSLDEKTSFLSSHPAVGERVERMRQLTP